MLELENIVIFSQIPLVALKQQLCFQDQPVLTVPLHHSSTENGECAHATPNASFNRNTATTCFPLCTQSWGPFTPGGFQGMPSPSHEGCKGFPHSCDLFSWLSSPDFPKEQAFQSEWIRWKLPRSFPALVNGVSCLRVKQTDFWGVGKPADFTEELFGLCHCRA